MNSESHTVIENAKRALSPGDNTQREQRVLRIGNLTGLREENGIYRRANFERGLLLDSLVSSLRPERILELGTGRGLGAFVMAEAAKDAGYKPQITTVDVLTTDTAQNWPIEADGKREIRNTSRREVWGNYFTEDVRTMITEVCGPTTDILPQMLLDERKFGLIFIDAGHDLYSVVHDLCYVAMLLDKDGWTLMDDFAPASEYGLATCLASTHARSLFGVVEVLATEGLVFGGTQIPSLPRSMVLLGEARDGIKFDRAKLFFWRLANHVLNACYRPALFPLSRKA